MAINRDPNSLLAHFSGRVGHLIIKKYSDKIVLSAIPDMSKRKLSPKQKEANKLMKVANIYAKSMTATPERKTAAAKLLGKHLNEVYHALVAEYISKKGDPEKMIKLPALKAGPKKN